METPRLYFEQRRNDTIVLWVVFLLSSIATVSLIESATLTDDLYSDCDGKFQNQLRMIESFGVLQIIGSVILFAWIIKQHLPKFNAPYGGSSEESGLSLDGHQKRRFLAAIRISRLMCLIFAQGALVIGFAISASIWVLVEGKNCVTDDTNLWWIGWAVPISIFCSISIMMTCFMALHQPIMVSFAIPYRGSLVF